MNNEYFAEMHKMIEKAKTYERIGREEEALNIYLEIHVKFFPNTSDLFERPAILLEKRKRFDESIQICEKAIKLINEGKITGIKDNFERRIQRIKTRSDYEGGKQSASKKDHSKEVHDRPEKIKIKREKPEKPTREQKEPFHFPEIHLPHFTHNKSKPDIKVDAVEPIETVQNTQRVESDNFNRDIEQKNEETTEVKRASFSFKNIHFPKINWEKYKAYFNDLKTQPFKWRKPKKNEIIALVILVGFIGAGVYAIMNKPESKFEVMIDMKEFRSNSNLEGSPFEKKLEDLPPITKSMIDIAVKETQSMMGVKQAGIIVQKDVVGMVVILNPGATKAQAKAATEVFVKALARAAAAENKELSAPGMVGYGELFDYYTLIVVAGENYDNLILKGSKNARALGIYWRNE